MQPITSIKKHREELVSDTIRYRKGYFEPVQDDDEVVVKKKKVVGPTYIKCGKYKITDREYKQLVVRYYTARMYDTYSFEEYFHAMAKKIVRTIGEAQYGDTLVTLRG